MEENERAQRFRNFSVKIYREKFQSFSAKFVEILLTTLLRISLKSS